jgi:hypothetical protein
MQTALKDIFVPALSAMDFSGTVPHFRRKADDRADYVSIQFYSSEGSFVVELASAACDGKPVGYGRDLPLDRLNTQYFTDRHRLGSKPGSDHRYVFGPRSYDAEKPLRPAQHYANVARQAVDDLAKQAERWLVEGQSGLTEV